MEHRIYKSTIELVMYIQAIVFNYYVYVQFHPGSVSFFPLEGWIHGVFVQEKDQV